MLLQYPPPSALCCALICSPKGSQGVQTASLGEPKMEDALQKNTEYTLAADKHLSCTARLELAQSESPKIFSALV